MFTSRCLNGPYYILNMTQLTALPSGKQYVVFKHVEVTFSIAVHVDRRDEHVEKIPTSSDLRDHVSRS